MLFSHSISQVCLRRFIGLLLLVTVWNGPVPVFHWHEGNSNDLVFRRHVEKFHSEEADVEHLGAHWHFAFLDEFAGDLLPGFFSHRLPMPCLLVDSPEVGQHGGDLSGHLIRSAEWLVCSTQRDRLFTTACAVTPQSFMSTLLCVVPLIAVTGVCQT